MGFNHAFFECPVELGSIPFGPSRSISVSGISYLDDPVRFAGNLYPCFRHGAFEFASDTGMTLLYAKKATLNRVISLHDVCGSEGSAVSHSLRSLCEHSKLILDALTSSIKGSFLDKCVVHVALYRSPF